MNYCIKTNTNTYTAKSDTIYNLDILCRTISKLLVFIIEFLVHIRIRIIHYINSRFIEP